MTFGLRNTGNTFQRMMDRILAGLSFVFCYLDDIIIASKDKQEHLEHLREVFSRLREPGLVINAEKCVFAATTVEFLGHKVSAAGVEPLHSIVQAVRAHPEPPNISKLQAFLGTVNFYRRFLPAVARILKPLTDLLIGGPKGTEPVRLADPQGAAKDALAAATCLAHPSQGFQLSLMVDAFADHISGALQQRRRPADPCQPLGFFSRKLDSTQVKYSAFNRELLACFQAIRHFRFMLEGRRFTLFTDHKPLTTAVRRLTEPWTTKQCRQLAYIAEFTSDIQHIAGSDNVVADTLSRPPSGAAAGSGLESPLRGTVRADRGNKDKIKLSTSSGGLRSPVEALPEVNAVRATPAAVDYAALAAQQGACPLTQRAASSTSLQVEKRVVGSVELLCDVSRGGVRLLVPLVDRPAVFAAFHGLAHAGMRATKRLIAARVMWRGLNSDVAAWVKNCQQCERAKASRQHTTAVQPIAIPARRFTHIHVDIVGPLPAATCGSRYLFTVVDKSSRWLEALPMRDIAAASCADALIIGWISRYGVPAQLTSDRGTQFTSAIWDALCQQLGIQHQPTTAFHPQANGMVERCHRRLKDPLRARLAGLDWPLHLPWVLMGLRAAPTEDTGVSAAEVVFSAPLVLPGQILDTEEPPPADFVAKLRQSGPLPLLRPLSYAQMAAKPPAALLSEAFLYIQKGSTVPPCRRSTAALQGPRLGPEGVPATGGRAGDGLHRPP